MRYNLTIVAAVTLAALFATTGTQAAHPRNLCKLLRASDINRLLPGAQPDKTSGPHSFPGFCVYTRYRVYTTHALEEKETLSAYTGGGSEGSPQQAFAYVKKLAAKGRPGWITGQLPKVGGGAVTMFTKRPSKTHGLQGEIAWLRPKVLYFLIVDGYGGTRAHLEHGSIGLARIIAPKT